MPLCKKCHAIFYDGAAAADLCPACAPAAFMPMILVVKPNPKTGYASVYACEPGAEEGDLEQAAKDDRAIKLGEILTRPVVENQTIRNATSIYFKGILDCSLRAASGGKIRTVRLPPMEEA